MYARANLITADPAKIDDGIRYVADNVLTTVQSVPGNRGLAMSVDREGGRGVLVTFWDSMDDLRASEEQVGSLREEANRVFGGTLEPRVLEVLEQHIREMPRAGCWTRATTVQMSPEDIDKTAEVFRTSTVPGLDAMDGFCGAILHADREAGTCVAVTTWRDRATLESSRERASVLRQEVADKAHGTVASIEEMEMVHFMRREG